MFIKVWVKRIWRATERSECGNGLRVTTNKFINYSWLFFNMFDDHNKLENLYHTALIYSKKVGIGTEKANEKLKRLLKDHGSFEGVYNHFFNRLLTDEEDPKKTKGLEKLVKSLDKIDFDFRLLTVNDVEFPDHLAMIEGAPPAIYVRGDIELLNKTSIGVVGTRDLTDSKERSEGNAVVKRIVDKEYVVVSGLAAGCDTLGHSRAIEYGGKTIAVIGTPLNKSYPKENRKLQELIAEEHLLVSQYPIGINTFPSHFAHRNITTAGLSTEGIIVIKAGDKSGTQHAIRHCLNQDKPLYVLANNFGKGYEWVERHRGKIKVPNGAK